MDKKAVGLAREKEAVWRVLFFAFFWATAGALVFAFYAKGDIVLFWQARHTLTLDRWFVIITQLGEAGVIITLGLLMLFQRVGATLFMACSLLLTTAVVQLGKLVLFADHVRPKLWLQAQGIELLPVGELSINGLHAMPSGHTAAAFALFTCLGIVSRTPVAQVVFWVIAAAVGLSRIYLGQHFWQDVYAGALVGLLVPVVTYGILQWAGIWQRRWTQQPIQQMWR